jgi:MerR family mercuric resistance operon transcriptional regulator
VADHGIGSGLKRGDVARRTGCNLETIRYYEKIGLLLEPPRNANSYRIYDDTHIRRLRFILRGRELGFSIEDIRGLLSLVDGGTHSCANVKTMTEHHLTDVRTKIADLRRIETILAKTAAQCSGDEAPECPILEALAS